MMLDRTTLRVDEEDRNSDWAGAGGYCCALPSDTTLFVSNAAQWTSANEQWVKRKSGDTNLDRGKKATFLPSTPCGIKDIYPSCD